MRHEKSVEENRKVYYVPIGYQVFRRTPARTENTPVTDEEFFGLTAAYRASSLKTAGAIDPGPGGRKMYRKS